MSTEMTTQDETSLFDQRDESQIIAELEGRYIQEFVYSFKQGNQTVTGLSWKGVQEAAREMGGIHVPMDKMKITETETHVHVVVEAVDTERNSSRIGVAAQAKIMETSGGPRPDHFCYQKAVSKAQRNAIIQLIPQSIVKSWIEKRLGKQ